jgi:hypothetical protein
MMLYTNRLYFALWNKGVENNPAMEGSTISGEYLLLYARGTTSKKAAFSRYYRRYFYDYSLVSDIRIPEELFKLFI